ncbi:MAG: thymidine phosphorylase [Ignavibacteriaceae bacterium]|nr:thymidine phosphorylase [Ignavibacteriaceae bacterium]
MNAVEIIINKRDGYELTKEAIDFFINGYTNGEIPDYQMSALLMAIYTQGMTKAETSALTGTMLHSGEIFDLSGMQGYRAGKHSTGGVGDKTTLILTPIAAEAGIIIPQVTGRGLGHTGGTLDKLEAIPGFNAGPTPEEFKHWLATVGGLMIGQTKTIAPADRLIYALRDVTGTVESIPLITASIMSKKLAEGTNGVVFDVKTGTGAFMKTHERAKALANSLMNTAKSFGKDTFCFITEMSQPLGQYIGNWHEVYETVRVLQGDNVPDLCEITHYLTGAIFVMAKKAETLEEGYALSESYIKSGKALDRFYRIIEAQGGDLTHLKDLESYPQSKYKEYVYAGADGYISSIDSYILGRCVIELGGGRLKKEDSIDPKAGIVFYPKIGDKIKKGDLIAVFDTDKKEAIDKVKASILSSIDVVEGVVPRPDLIKEIIN